MFDQENATIVCNGQITKSVCWPVFVRLYFWGLRKSKFYSRCNTTTTVSLHCGQSFREQCFPIGVVLLSQCWKTSHLWLVTVKISQRAVLYRNCLPLKCEGVGITCWLPRPDPWRERVMGTNPRESCLQQSYLWSACEEMSAVLGAVELVLSINAELSGEKSGVTASCCSCLWLSDLTLPSCCDVCCCDWREPFISERKSWVCKFQITSFHSWQQRGFL